MTRYLWVLAAGLGMGWVISAPGKAVDLKAIEEAGKQTEAKLGNTPASWEVENQLPSGAVIRVAMDRDGRRWRAIFFLDQGGQSQEIERIVCRDGLWFKSDAFGDGKYRPFEAPLIFPLASMALIRSELMFASAGRFAGDRVEKVEGNIATFRESLDPAVARQLQGAIAQTEAAFGAGTEMPEGTRSQIAALKDLIANGMPTVVDESSGVVLEFGSPKMRSRVKGFQFLGQAEEADFAVDGKQWEDNSDDPTAGDVNDLLMMGHEPGFAAGQKNYDLEGVLMDVKTGRFRRIPYPGVAAVGMCFSRDRRSIFVAGMNESGGLRPYEIDLKSEDCRAVGSPALDSGITLMGDLSPDGSALAVLHMDPAKGFLREQVYLIDLKSGAAKAIGPAGDLAYPNWTTDGHRLVLLSRKAKDMNTPTVGTLIVMDMDGKVTELRGGDSPTLLADRKTILYEDQGTQLWHTCDLGGGNDRLFGDGFKSYGFPAVGPDGKRVLMMQFIPGALPVPMVLRDGEGPGVAVTNIAGLWGEAVWR